MPKWTPEKWRGAYSLSLLCDQQKCANAYEHTKRGRVHRDFIASDRKAAERLARHEGWELHHSECTATCPICVIENKTDDEC